MKPAVKVMRDGREVLNLKTAKGKRIYKERLLEAWDKQHGRCAKCKRSVPFEGATADHIKPRGMGGGSRDDRQENIQMMCWRCNTMKGSRRI